MKKNWTPGLLAEFEDYDVSVDAESSLGNRLVGWHVLGNPEAGNGEMFVVLHFDGTPESEYDANSDRLKACWNAMAGIENPAAYVAAMGACAEALAAVQRTMDGYRSQMKFCDVEALGYFREFDRRVEASGFRAALTAARATMGERDA